MNLTYFQSWALAFALTQLVEMPIYRGVARVRWWQAASLSLATHPVVWYVFPLLSRTGLAWTYVLWLAEAFAYIVEAALLRAYGVRWPRAIAAAILANTASIIAGELVRARWGIP